MKDFFKPEDFALNEDDSYTTIYTAASLANEKLFLLIESMPVVYGDTVGPWSRATHHRATHKARLAFVEEIVKEPCKHEPDKVGLFNNFDNPSQPHFAYNSKCKHCGVELQATWSEK